MGKAQTRTRQVTGATGPVYVQGREKHVKGMRRIHRGVWCGMRCSSGLCHRPVALRHCVRGSSQGVPQRMSMAEDDRMISAESMDELLVKKNTLKVRDEEEGQCMDFR